jgi:prepilin-type N-terminal cleavage/methylation domain-containing protein
MKTRHTSSATAGFSLFEMLMAVAIIGILVSVVVPVLSSSSGYETARDRRNAQEMTAVCMAAQAAGLNLVVPGDLAGTVRNILAGGAPTTGAFSGQGFRASGLQEADAMKALTYLQINGNTLEYNFAGNL